VLGRHALLAGAGFLRHGGYARIVTIM